MDTEAGFRSVLTTANFGAKPKTAIIDFCCDTLTELAHLPRTELNTSIGNLHKALANVPIVNLRVRLNATKITLLHAISLHFLDRIKCDAVLLMPALTALVTDDIKEMRTHYNEHQQSKAADGLSSVTVPKLKSTTWSEFKSGIVETLSRVKGRNDIPLSYVIRNDVVGDFKQPYESREERLVSCITQKGPAFKSDNSDVFSILLQHTENTEGYSLIEAQEKSRNGRKAWLSLLSHFEGDTFKERVAQEANTILRTVIYHGPRKNFSFGDYYTRHSKAHIKLLKADKPMSAQQQIDTFIAGIKCATAQTIIVNISGDLTIRTSFDKYYNAIASKLELALQLTNQMSQTVNRQVSQLDSNRNKHKNNNGQNHDSRNNKRPKQGDPNSGFTPELKIYPGPVWKRLTKANQDKVKALYVASRNRNRPQGSQNNHPQRGQMVPYTHLSQRNVSQVGFYTPQMEAQLQEPYHNTWPPPRAISQVSAPPYNQGYVPPPPPLPPTPSLSVPQHPNERVSGNAGDMGQYFGGNSGRY